MKSPRAFAGGLFLGFSLLASCGMRSSLAQTVDVPNAPSTAQCQRISAAQPRRLLFSHENDFFGRTDRDYTSGVYMGFHWGRYQHFADDPCRSAWTRSIAGWLNRIPSVDTPDRIFVLGFGQQIYTPTDGRTSAVLSNERPYAAWLFSRWGLHAFGVDRSSTLALDIGVIGPAAQGERSQNFFHSIEGYPRFQGWANQLRNEAGIQLAAEWRQVLWREAVPVASSRRSPDSEYELGPRISLIGHYGLGLGNVETYANLGLQLRLGAGPIRSLSLPNSMRTSTAVAPLASSRRDQGLQFFTGFDLRGVARNIFLDGNSGGNSHSVTRKPVVADVTAGFAWSWDWADLAYTHTWRSREYEGQSYRQTFGALTVSFPTP